MEFKELKYISKVDRFILNEKLCFLSENNLIIEGKPFDSFETPIDCFEVFNNKLYINDWNGRYKITTLDGTHLEEGQGKAFFKSSKNYFGLQYLKNDVLNEALLNINDSVISINIQDKKNSINYSNTSIYCCLKNNQIYSYNLPSSIKKWKYNLLDLGNSKNYDIETFPIEVRQFVGEYNKVLWVFTNSGWFVGLDIQTGEQLHLIKSVAKENLNGTINNYLEEIEKFMFLDSDYKLHEGIIYGFVHDKLYQIDLNITTPLAQIFGLHDEFESKEIIPGNTTRGFVVQDKELYFMDCEQAKFAILNLDTKIVTYLSSTITTNDTLYWLKEIQVSENKVYLLGEDNTLHIFEKETPQLS